MQTHFVLIVNNYSSVNAPKTIADRIERVKKKSSLIETKRNWTLKQTFLVLINPTKGPTHSEMDTLTSNYVLYRQIKPKIYRNMIRQPMGMRCVWAFNVFLFSSHLTDDFYPFPSTPIKYLSTISPVCVRTASFFIILSAYLLLFYFICCSKENKEETHAATISWAFEMRTETGPFSIQILSSIYLLFTSDFRSDFVNKLWKSKWMMDETET